ncbi:DJ-1/PfpI family protein [Bacillus alkalicellulosilyticus]|uniref:DJ-1/PfpI family protein n=1 Tax=Alkalihalobacterium alkalicellulosilyticum TaxID=1912214 RepID=UPI00099897DA|nr:DJ-1/PfpI family protein [Bacillus alkalicellulosilyticus]
MKIVIFLYNGMTMLDAIGPYEVLRNIDGAEIMFVAEKKGVITSDSGVVHIEATYEMSEVSKADILLIPGSTIAFIEETKNKKVLKWIRKMDKKTLWTTSVCTGSFLLASAGLLKGLQATSHWRVLSLLSQYGVKPVRERVVEQDKYITASGVSSGIDMALYLTNKLVGEEEAKAIQLVVEYDPNPIYQSGSYNKADASIISRAKKKLVNDVKRELGFKGIFKHCRELIKLVNEDRSF